MAAMPAIKPSSKFDFLVNVSEAAFQSMVIATIESFLVPGRAGKAGRRTRQRETFGLLWGYETTTASKAKCFNVEVAIVDTNAERGRSSVVPSDGLETVNRALPTYWPNLKFLGDFHSHPWGGSEAWPKRPFLSDADRESIEDNPSYARLDYRVALLLNVRKLEKKGWKSPDFVHDNTLEFRLNDLRMSLAAWVACPAKNDSREPALYVIPRPRAVTQVKWKREPWHTRCRSHDTKRVWLNAPLHNLLTPLGD
jgi:proteasome lid subunit RPN8/RPN11